LYGAVGFTQIGDVDHTVSSFPGSGPRKPVRSITEKRRFVLKR
jgi:hypothetical protein